MGLLRLAKRAGEAAWYTRSRLGPLNVPVPCRLPYGGWFLAYGDAIGARVLGYRLSRHPYEEGGWRLVARLLRPGMTFVDVGANQGFFTLLAARSVGPTGRVIAFEPAPSELRRLRRNLRLNGFDNVTTEGTALGARAGTSDFHLLEAHQGSFSSLRPPADDVSAPERVIRVPVVTLDSYVKAAGLRALDCLKIDVEGGELDVLRGAAQVLRRFQPVLLCEVEGRRTRQWGYEPGEILQLARGHGYEWFAPTTAGALRPFGAPAGQEWQNLVAIHATRTDLLRSLEAVVC